MKKLCFLTSADFPYLNDDDQMLFTEAEAQGFATAIYIWDEFHQPKENEIYIIRSIWDYYKKFPQFQKWIKNFSTSNLLNSPEVVRWNWDKLYLEDLKSKGIPVVPSLFFKKDELIEVPTDWKKVVIKPSVSAGADMTKMFLQEEVQLQRSLFEQIWERSHVMMQPFIESVQTDGEISLMFFNDKKETHYSHAVLKKAVSGDFRVQNEFGGTIENYEANEKLISFAKSALQTVNEPWLYSRVDIVNYKTENFLIGEIELIEPQLFFKYSRHSTFLFLRCLSQWMSDS